MSEPEEGIRSLELDDGEGMLGRLGLKGASGNTRRGYSKGVFQHGLFGHVCDEDALGQPPPAPNVDDDDDDP